MSVFVTFVLAAQLGCYPSTDSRSIDFFNFTYEVAGRQITVTEGEWVRHEPMDRAYVVVEDVYDVDLTGDGLAEGAVSLGSYWGGNGFFDEIQVFTAASGEPHLLGILPGGDRENGGINDLGVREGRFWIQRVFRHCPSCKGHPCALCCVVTGVWWDGQQLQEDFLDENTDCGGAP